MVGDSVNIRKQTLKFNSDLQQIKYIVKSTSIGEEDLGKCITEVFEQSPSTNVSKLSSKKNQVKYTFNVVIEWIFNIFHVLCIATKTLFAAVLLCIVIYLLITTHNVTQKFILRKFQNYIYPVMRTVRLWTLPAIKSYQSLTDWHEEDCLIKNPFYQEPLLDCWPCEDVRTMVDLTALYNYSKAYIYNEKPFLVRDVMEKKFTIDDLAEIYQDHKIKLDRGTARFSSTHKSINTLCKLVENKDSLTSMKKFQVLWKINRVAAARVLRKTFKRPYFVPSNSEVALQRFLTISGAEAPQFFLPMTDFANVWIAQGQGYRLIVLDPTEPCQNNCSTLSVLLRPQDVLYYNWQFWKPRSLPARLSEELSISYMGSFY